MSTAETVPPVAVFFWALAACWWTRMLELSIIWMPPS